MGKTEAAIQPVAAAERQAVEAQRSAMRIAEATRQLVAACFKQVTTTRHRSEEDAKQARAMLAEARELLARAEKLTE
jgi:hypothetical protein